MSFLNSVWAGFVSFWNNLVLWMVWLTGATEAYAQLFLIAVLAYIVLVLILIKVHHIMSKMQRKRIKACVYEYDRIWYLTAQSMYKFNEEMKAAGKENKLAHWTRSILTLEDKDYLHNRKKIFADVKKLEEYLGKPFVDAKVLKKINNLHLKITSSNVLHKIVGWALTGMTAWLYLLAWKRVYYR